MRRADDGDAPVANHRGAPNKAGQATSSVPNLSQPSDGRHDPTTPEVYRTSPVNRTRRTKVEIGELQDAILAVCEADHPLSVRGVFYRVMSAGAVAKTEKAYAAVQREVLKLRRAGVLPYEWIADGTRWHIKSPSWNNVETALEDAATSYRRALWHDQDVYVEVWSEKEAISSIVAPITDAWDVPLMIARGFASESFLWQTAATIRTVGKPTIVYNLGDHDPSGLAAWEHVQRRLRDFAPDVPIVFERLAVTPGQIVELGLPTRPTKKSDSRSKTFVGESVEVDAIPTSVLRRIVENAIVGWIDEHALDVTRLAEESEREGFCSRWRTGGRHERPRDPRRDARRRPPGARAACRIRAADDPRPRAVRDPRGHRPPPDRRDHRALPCGATVDYDAAVAGKVNIAEVHHEARCPAATKKLVKAVRRWAR